MQARSHVLGLWLLLLGMLGPFIGIARAAHATLLADTHVNAALPAVNSGTLSNMNVGGGYTGLLQFDLGTLPTGTTSAQITRATLFLYVNRVDTAGLVSLSALTGAWNEYGVTYQTLPGISSAATLFPVAQAWSIRGGRRDGAGAGLGQCPGDQLWRGSQRRHGGGAVRQ